MSYEFSTSAFEGSRAVLNPGALTFESVFGSPKEGMPRLKPADTDTADLRDWWKGVKEFFRGVVFGTYTRAESCPTSELYEDALTKVEQHFYDQEKVKLLKDYHAKYNCQIKSPEDAIRFLNDALKLLDDPFTGVAGKEAIERMENATKGEKYFGIGVRLVPPDVDKEGKALKVQPIVGTVFPGSPAEKAGMQSGDILMAVEGKNTGDMTQEEVVGLIKGPEGSLVKVKIDRDGKMMDLTIGRAQVQIPASVEKMVGDKVLYVQLFDFMNDGTDVALSDALNNHPEAKGLILDLRGNPGGRVPELFETLSVVMKKGPLLRAERQEVTGVFKVSTKIEMNFDLNDKGVLITTNGFGSDGMPRSKYMLGDKPMVVLVDEYSASASELFAGAVKDNGVAELVGEKTFGKGVGQTGMSVKEDGLLMVTDTRYVTPKGVWSGDGHKQKNGITPNLEIVQGNRYVPLSERDVQFTKALELVTEKAKKAG